MSDIKIILETPHVVVVDKPAGIPTIPDRFGSGSVHTSLSEARGEKLWVVHRLDREVTGILVFARTAEAHRSISMAFERHTVEKRYEAWTTGEAEVGLEIRWEDKLLRGKKRSYASPHGKEAVTEGRVVGKEEGRLRWHLRPLTGRNHQIRVHLSQAGFPILGDALYGSKEAWPAGIALRAIRLTVPEGEIPALDLTVAGDLS